ncbi:MAG: minor capsid protein [Deltaproteobacteria bacterium]|nr:minor capsid protein [Deltaproteobacteria bacterium]
MVRRERIPLKIARDYYREIRQLLDEAHRMVWDAFVNEIVPRIKVTRQQSQPLTAYSASLATNATISDVTRILDRLEVAITSQVFNTAILREIARQFVQRILNANNRAMQAQFGRLWAVRGIDPTATDEWLEALIETAVEENVQYIKSVSAQYHREVRNIIIQGVKRGTNINDLKSAIAERAKVSQSRAKFIARDQLGSIYSDITRHRQQRMGLKKFRWVTARDERVRESHQVLDGQVFTWKDGARNERGEQIWPGTDYNCRCVAIPVAEELAAIKEGTRQ